MTKKTRHTLVDKRGNEILSSDSFLGFAGKIYMMMIGATIVFAIIMFIFCAIGSLFS